MLLLTVTVGVVPSVTAPVPVFKGAVPTKVKLELQLWEMLLASVMALPLVLSNVPPLIFKAPVPSAEELPRFSRPA